MVVAKPKDLRNRPRGMSSQNPMGLPNTRKLTSRWRRWAASDRPYGPAPATATSMLWRDILFLDQSGCLRGFPTIPRDRMASSAREATSRKPGTTSVSAAGRRPASTCRACALTLPTCEMRSRSGAGLPGALDGRAGLVPPLEGCRCIVTDSGRERVEPGRPGRVHPGPGIVAEEGGLAAQIERARQRLGEPF